MFFITGDFATPVSTYLYDKKKKCRQLILSHTKKNSIQDFFLLINIWLIAWSHPMCIQYYNGWKKQLYFSYDLIYIFIIRCWSLIHLTGFPGLPQQVPGDFKANAWGRWVLERAPWYRFWVNVLGASPNLDGTVFLPFFFIPDPQFLKGRILGGQMSSPQHRDARLQQIVSVFPYCMQII